MRNARTTLKVLGWVWLTLILPFAWISIQVIEQLPRKGFPQNLYDTTLGFLFLPGWPIFLTYSVLTLLLLATIVAGILALRSKQDETPTPTKVGLTTTNTIRNNRGATSQIGEAGSGIIIQNSPGAIINPPRVPVQPINDQSDHSAENCSPVRESTASRVERSPWIPFQMKIYEPTQLPISQGNPNDIFPYLAPSPASVQEVYGWKRDRYTLLDCVRRGAGASIVGPRRIGKSWLLHYVRLMISVEHQLGANYRVCYLDTDRCATVYDFTVLVLEQLGVRVSPDNVPWNLEVLDKAISKLILHNISPVLCLDEFESLSGSPRRLQEFDRDFYRGLRAMGQGGVRLVVASKHNLIDIVPPDPLSSPFFNTFEKFLLRPFDDKEAETFAEVKSSQAGLTNQERTYLLKYGTKDKHQWPPIRLQLVGKEMLTAKSLAVSEGSSYYRPDDPDYWRDFEKLVDEKYDAVVVG